MCGRFAQAQTREAYLAFLADEAERDIAYDPAPIGRYNVAPGTKVLLLSERDSQLHLDPVFWGYLKHQRCFPAFEVRVCQYLRTPRQSGYYSVRESGEQLLSAIRQCWTRFLQQEIRGSAFGSTCQGEIPTRRFQSSSSRQDCPAGYHQGRFAKRRGRQRTPPHQAPAAYGSAP